jgi:hypothetical protein
MQTATDGTKREGFAAPVHSPNEFHLGPNGELVNGLGTTQYPANVKPVSPEEAVAMAEREQKVADAETRSRPRSSRRWAKSRRKRRDSRPSATRSSARRPSSRSRKPQLRRRAASRDDDHRAAARREREGQASSFHASWLGPTARCCSSSTRISGGSCWSWRLDRAALSGSAAGRVRYRWRAGRLGRWRPVLHHDVGRRVAGAVGRRGALRRFHAARRSHWIRSARVGQTRPASRCRRSSSSSFTSPRLALRRVDEGGHPARVEARSFATAVAGGLHFGNRIVPIGRASHRISDSWGDVTSVTISYIAMQTLALDDRRHQAAGAARRLHGSGTGRATGDGGPTDEMNDATEAAVFIERPRSRGSHSQGHRARMILGEVTTSHVQFNG